MLRIAFGIVLAFVIIQFAFPLALLTAAGSLGAAEFFATHPHAGAELAVFAVLLALAFRKRV